MAYKLKPHKGMAKRFKVSATGKVKHRHEKSTHLRSGRSAKLKRHLGRPGVLAEGMARNVRRYLGLKKLKPLQVEHERALEAKEAQQTEKSAK
jgi:large subunit ribosomal protein L35